VVQILDYGVHAGTPFMAMELLDGESLAQRLRRQGRLEIGEVARIVTHVARAIHKAHESGVVHRDLKPDNVFLVRNADEEIAKVLDFGIAKTVAGDDPGQMATQTGAVLGTPHYMSPEQARGTRTVDHRTDLWSLGVIAFECTTGRRPFESSVLGDLLLKICAEPVPVPSSVAAVPPGFDQWFARVMEREPGRRFQSALEMAEAFRTLAGGTLAPVPPPHPGVTLPFGPGSAPFPPPSVSAPAVSAPTELDTGHQMSVAHTRPIGALGSSSSKKAPFLLVAMGLLGLLGVFGAAALGLYFFLSTGAEAPAAAGSVPVTAKSATAATQRSVASATPSRHADPTGSKGSASDKPSVAVGSPGTSPRPKTDAGSSWQDDVAKAQADAKKAQDDANKAQDDAAKAKAEADAIRKKALEGLPQ
jgi:serine/threonine-protein kinase